MIKSKSATLVAAMILMAVPSAGRAGTLLPDDHGIALETSVDETHGTIHRIGGIDPIHNLFDITDAISLKSAGCEMTGKGRARDSLSGSNRDGKIDGVGVFGGDETSTRNGFEFHDFRSAGAARSVPEPSSLSLIALAGIGYVARFLRRHRICLSKV